MVRSFLLYLMFFLLPLSSFSAAQQTSDIALLNVVPDKTQVEMGKFLSVSIVYIGDSVPETSYLGKWFADFFIDRRETETENLPNGLIQYTEFLRLYPRSTGNKVLGSIAMGGAFAQPVSIDVKPVIRKGIDGTPHWQLLPENIWQGETIKVSIVQNLLHPSNQVVVENVLFPGFYVQGPEKEVIVQNNIKMVQLSWLLTAHNHGTFQLDPPAIVQRGRGRWVFYLPRAVLKVKPLPSYIPPTIPVGMLSIQTELRYKEEKPFWWIELRNEGQLPEEIYGIRTQLSNLAKVSIESVRQLSIEQSKTQVNPDYLSGFVHRYLIPVPEWTWGINEGPEISVPYFDVHDGQIKTISQKLPSVWNISKSWLYALFIMLIFIILLIFKLIYTWLKNILKWQQYLRLINQTNQAHNLKKILLTQGDFLTLEAWSAVAVDAKRVEKSKHIAKQLNILCYTRSSQISINEVKRQIINFHTFSYWLIFNK